MNQREMEVRNKVCSVALTDSAHNIWLQETTKSTQDWMLQVSQLTSYTVSNAQMRSEGRQRCRKPCRSSFLLSSYANSQCCLCRPRCNFPSYSPSDSHRHHWPLLVVFPMFVFFFPSSLHFDFVGSFQWITKTVNPQRCLHEPRHDYVHAGICLCSLRFSDGHLK